MLEWSSDATKGSDDQDLLELYCGGGTFTAALAGNFRRVVATEMSKASVELAHKAFAANGITNIKIARLSSEEFTEAYEGARSFQVHLPSPFLTPLGVQHAHTTRPCPCPCHRHCVHRSG
jgi:tRNA (uracil-5-)-methyltransferase